MVSVSLPVIRLHIFDDRDDEGDGSSLITVFSPIFEKNK